MLSHSKLVYVLTKRYLTKFQNKGWLNAQNASVILRKTMSLQHPQPQSDIATSKQLLKEYKTKKKAWEEFTE